MTSRTATLLSRNGPALVLLALFLVAASLQHGFLSRLNLSAIAFQYSVIGLIALGQFVVMLTRGIDLSQGSVIAAGSMAAAATASSFGISGGVAAGLLAGALIGLCNGLLAAFTRVPPFVITLGMLGIVRGLALTVTNSRPIPVTAAGFFQLARGRTLDIPNVFLLFLAIGLLLALFLRGWPLGRQLYAIGGSEENSRLSGVPVARVKITAYTLSGLLAGLAGIVLTSRMGTGHPLSGMNYELESIAAAVIGGASLFGGAGRTAGIVSGVLILGVVNSMINLSGASPYLHGTIKGGVILLAVAISQLRVGSLLRRPAAAGP